MGASDEAQLGVGVSFSRIAFSIFFGLLVLRGAWQATTAGAWAGAEPLVLGLLGLITSLFPWKVESGRQWWLLVVAAAILTSWWGARLREVAIVAIGAALAVGTLVAIQRRAQSHDT